jgi:nonsense-mediated mRNA decay protein 3
MPKRFCYLCGKITEDLIEGKCRDCFLKEKQILKLPEKINAKICRDCLKYYKRGKWVHLSDMFEEVLQEASIDSLRDSLTVEHLTHTQQEVKIAEIREVSKNSYQVVCELEIRGDIGKSRYEESRSVPIDVDLNLCRDCGRRRGGYYEAILQIRDSVPKGIQEEISQMVEARIKKDGKAFITEIRELKEGIDFYMGSLKAARKIAKELKKKYGGNIKESPKLAGINKNGRKIYRVTIAVRLQHNKT